jgi:hypothetical protein
LVCRIIRRLRNHYFQCISPIWKPEGKLCQAVWVGYYGMAGFISKGKDSERDSCSFRVVALSTIFIKSITPCKLSVFHRLPQHYDIYNR